MVAAAIMLEKPTDRGREALLYKCVSPSFTLFPFAHVTRFALAAGIRFFAEADG